MTGGEERQGTGSIRTRVTSHKRQSQGRRTLIGKGLTTHRELEVNGS